MFHSFVIYLSSWNCRPFWVHSPFSTLKWLPKPWVRFTRAQQGWVLQLLDSWDITVAAVFSPLSRTPKLHSKIWIYILYECMTGTKAEYWSNRQRKAKKKGRYCILGCGALVGGEGEIIHFLDSKCKNQHNLVLLWCAVLHKKDVAFWNIPRLLPFVLIKRATCRWMEQWWNDTDRGNWSTGRKTLYSVGGRWMNGYGAMVEWYWQGKLKYWEKNISCFHSTHQMYK